jgi:predicted Zn-dependent peptidase
MVKKLLGTIGLFLLLITGTAVDNSISFLRLANGLEVIISPLQSTNAVSILTIHKIGVKNEPPDIKGTSFLLKDLIPFCGSDNLNTYNRFLTIKQKGAGEYIFLVNQDYSFLFQLITPDLLENAIWFEKERMESLQIPDSYIDQVKNRAFKNYMNLYNNDVLFKENDWLKNQLLKGTEYEQPIYGDLNKIRQIPHNRIKRFYLNISEPQNTLLIICGKITAKTVKPLLEKHFSPIQSYKINSAPDFIQKQDLTVNPLIENRLYKNIDQSILLYGFSAPSKFSLDYFTYQFLIYFLLDERISMLNDIFNISNQLKVEIFYEFTDQINSNCLIIGFKTKSRVNIEKIKITLKRIFSNLRTTKLSFNDLKSTKSLMKLDYVKKLNNLRERPRILAEHYLMYKNLNHREAFFKKLNMITPQRIINVIKKYFSDNYIRLNVYKK